MPKKIRKILIANRGEIAVRIIRACQDLGIRSVAVYSECDQSAFHVRLADEAYYLGPSPSSESYLDHDRVLRAARDSGADAIHPGYGFLAENAEFAQKCVDAGIIFIGPKPQTIALLGDKLVARKTAVEAGLPVLSGTDNPTADAEAATQAARKIGFPVLIKAAAGGGGKGMRVVESEDQFSEALTSASNEAQSSFGDGRVFVEKYLAHPRHIEIQIMCDTHGNCIHLGERECSIQRRHQKVIEESPSPVVDETMRTRMGDAAVSIARKSGYVGAGTVEFLVDTDMSFYFLEVNTRLQVEHPVTELVTGLDLVKLQVAVAEGKKLSLRQKDIKLTGHAIECRIYAENPSEGFIPSTGKLKNYRIPAGPGVRVDSGVVIFSEIPIYYDPMIAKLAVWGRSREEALARSRRALAEYRLSGVSSTIGFHLAVLSNKRFIRGDISTRFLEEEYPDNQYNIYDRELAERAAIAAAVDRVVTESKISVSQSHNHRQKQSGWVSFYRRSSLEKFGGSR